MGKHFTIEKRKILTAWGKMKILILWPKKRTAEPATGVLWIHGGGYATGMPEMALFSRARDLVVHFGAVVVTPDYRLSGKAPYPAALEDCNTALEYLRDHAQELGIKENQIMVGGESAGGGLTAALCMYARDRGRVKVAFQMPLYPMLDDRDTESSRDNHAPIWNTKRNHAAWKLYLKGVQPVPAYAAPARQEDYTGLPPAYTFVGSIEPFYCETLDYVAALREAGVAARVDVYENCFHAFDLFLLFSKVRKEAVATFRDAFAYAQEHYFAAQEER